MRCTTRGRRRRRTSPGSAAAAPARRGVQLLALNGSRRAGAGAPTGAVPPSAEQYSSERGCNALTVPYERRLCWRALLALGDRGGLAVAALGQAGTGGQASTASGLPALRPDPGRHDHQPGLLRPDRPTATSAWTRPTRPPSAAASGRRAPRTSTSSTPACSWPASVGDRRRRLGRRHRPARSSSTRRARREHGDEVEPIYNSSSPADVADLARCARCVPFGDAVGDLFNPLLQPAPPRSGCKPASQGDVWFMTWDGNPSAHRRPPAPARRRGRDPRPGLELPDRQRGHRLLHLHVLQRHVHQPGRLRSVRPAMRPSCVDKAPDFQAENNATVQRATSRPAATRSTASSRPSRADMDVANAGTNYSSVNLPFALGYCYDAHVRRARSAWTLRPDDLRRAVLRRLRLRGRQVPPEPDRRRARSSCSRNTINGSPFPAPSTTRANAVQLYRYLSGTSRGRPATSPATRATRRVTHICFNNTQPRTCGSSSRPPA